MTTGTLQHQKGAHVLHHDPGAARLAVEQDEARELEALKAARRRDERLWLAGRLLMSVVFLTAATAKALTFDDTAKLLEAQGFSGTSFLLVIAIAIEAVGGAMMAMGMQVRRVASALAVWVAMVTLLLHHDLTFAWNRMSALSNVAMIAGLFFLIAHGAGPRSVDLSRRMKQAETEAQ
jgi:putative oxidoreductase